MKPDVWTLADGTIVSVLINGHSKATYDFGEVLFWHARFPQYKIRATLVKVT